MTHLLPEIDLLTISKKETDSSGTFVFEPLAPGYGMTLANPLRRILLSSLYGAAITTIKIEGADHEFSTIAGVKEDVVEIILNLKSLRLKLEGIEPVTLKISKKGPGPVKAADFSKSANVTIVDPEHHLATLSKNAKFNLEAKIEKNRGYIPVEEREGEKLPISSIALDSVFTPVKKVHYEVENTRVGKSTNFDKLIMEITTDGSKTPTEVLLETVQILSGYLNKILEIREEKKENDQKEIKPKKSGKKKSA